MKLHQLIENVNAKRIDIAYEIINLKSGKVERVEDTGWDEHIVVDDPDETIFIDKAIDIITSRGRVEPSSTHFNDHIWYATIDNDINYRTGEEISYSFHLVNFTVDEEKEIFERLVKNN
jgi:hypothetical protein